MATFRVSSPPDLATIQDDGSRTVRFTNIQDLFRVINYPSGNDILIVTGVSPADFAEIERERDRQRRRFRFRRYQSHYETLIIIPPTLLHETLHSGLYNDTYIIQLARADRYEDWLTMGATTFPEQRPPGADCAEGDSTGGPILERMRRGRWPTLVTLAEHSEPREELYRDMRWWFRTSNHDVKIVVLATFDRQKEHILIEKWEGDALHSQGAADGVLEPVKRQSITITRDETTDPVSYVSSDALVLEHRLLFLRDPGPQEGDFVFGNEELRRYAKRIWEVLSWED